MIKENKKIYIYIVLAFAFSIVVRLIWVYQFNDVEAFKWNGQFMINTNDGYFWAEGARDILGGINQEFSQSPTTTATSWLTAILIRILPFSFESVIFYIPAVLSSFVVIPMILIANSLRRVEIGFVSALIASIAWSYYSRTMVGYYDTDMLNILFPTLLLWSLILALNTQNEKYLLFTALEIVAYRFWYPQSYSLEFAFFGLILLYTLVSDRKNIYMYKLLTIMLFAMMGLPHLVRLAIVLAIFFGFKSSEFDKHIYKLLGLAILLFFITGGFNPILIQLKGYVFGSSIVASKDGMGLHFFSVLQTVREAGKIPFETFSNRISGHVITFFFSLVGYILFVYRYKVMLLSLPLLGLGFLAYVGGLRFTIYAVVPMAFGIGYLIFTCSDYLKRFLVEGRSRGYIQIAFISLATALVLYPNILHVMAYKVPTVMSKQEVKVLDDLSKIADIEDYTISWWDYGYPLRYYAKTNTLIDGGKHSGSVNFPISFMLTSPQQQASKLARLDVEYTEKTFRYIKNHKKEIEDKNLTIFSNIEQMTKDYGFTNTNDFLDSLNIDIDLPKKTRDIYFYLPFKMMGILPTLSRFSDLDLMSGKRNRELFFYKTNRFKDTKDKLMFSSGFNLDKKSGILTLNNQKIPIKEFFITYYDKNRKLIRQRQTIHKDANISIIFMRSYNTFLVLNENMLNSLYIQLFVFENYDKNLFEPVILDPSSKVFRLKI